MFSLKKHVYIHIINKKNSKNAEMQNFMDPLIIQIWKVITIEVILE